MDLTLYNKRQAFIESISNKVVNHILTRIDSEHFHNFNYSIVFNKLPINASTIKLISDTVEYKIISSGVINETKIKRGKGNTLNVNIRARRMTPEEHPVFGLDTTNMGTVEVEDPTPTD